MGTRASNPYLELTAELNLGRLRAIISSGQAVVMHRLAITSKDGDWILVEDREALDYVIGVLGKRGARYRFGAPLDLRWMRGGWSAHFEHVRDGMRLRTDFVTRPPRLSADDLRGLWASQAGRDLPFVDARRLALIKMTDREKDWPVIGEVARLLVDPREQLQFSRSARDILALLRAHPGLQEAAVAGRPALTAARDGEDALGAALDAERRALIRANEDRLETYFDAARAWRDAWPEVEQSISGLPLPKAHEIVVEAASRLLPPEVVRRA